ncbi:UDP-N-acetylmuramate dehydrogenase [Basilea psittacipulmonis]|nr:UDP-N-acetylmuramate dehydrogenase [Basilea psittacipulmonis]
MKMFDLYHANTFGIHAKALNYHEIKTIEAVRELPAYPAENIYILGGGSNVILNDVIQTPVYRMRIMGIDRLPDDGQYYYFEVGAGVGWHDFVSLTMEQACFGLENLALIPGTVGAAPVQNIGAYGSELARFVYKVKAWNRKTQQFYELSAQDCRFSYRHSLFKEEPWWCITSVVFKLPKQDEPNLSYPVLKEAVGLSAHPKAIFEAVCRIRREKLPDPQKVGNVGSFFKNCTIQPKTYQALLETYQHVPVFIQEDGSYRLPTAWLIEQAGWKGFSNGRVGVHDKQALVLINKGGACFSDVKKLAEMIQHSVAEKFGLTIEVEPSFWYE